MTTRFVEYLKNEFARRKSQNPGYSNRAFAKDLDISKSSLHDTLNGKTGFSNSTLEKISKKLGLSIEEAEDLLDENPSRENLKQDQFVKIHHWYHFAILNLAKLKNSRPCPRWIAEKLEINTEQAQQALNELSALKLISTNKNKLVRTSKHLNASWNVPSRALKVLHSGNLNRAEKALFEVPLNKRELTSITAALSEDQYGQLLKINEEYRQKVFAITESKSKPTEVYTIALQIFPQTYGDTND